MWHRLLDPRTACLLLALASGGLLLAAFALQYLGGLEPCQLCVWQRWPYVALVVIGLIGWRTGAGAMLALAVLVLLGGAGLGAYHTGVEQGWWALPEGCAVGDDAGSVEELKQLLADAPPACDQVQFTLLGLSLAVWNVISSLGLAGYAALILARASFGRRPSRRSERLV